MTTTTPIETRSFEPLYGYDSRNKQKQWIIKVEKYNDYSIMKYVYGYVDGKQVECSNVISIGKNIGKKNETTHFEQAILEAQSKWTKKKDEGYYVNENNNNDINENNNNDINVNNDKNANVKNNKTDNKQKKDSEIIYPMLAQDYNKHKQKLVFPAYIQPKLDGYRMIFNSSNCSCNSRQGKEFSIIKTTYLYQELKTLCDKEKIILDGELYVHGGVFENLGILRKKALTENDILNLEKIEYHIYDIVIDDVVFEKRYEKLKSLIEHNNFLKIKLVKTFGVIDETELKNYHNNFIKDNYEGSILRNKRGLYKKKVRSMDLLKYKDFEDDEFEIVDYTYEIDTSSENKNLIVWICKTSGEDQFNVRPGGTKEERQMLYKNCQDNFNVYKGRKLQVKYFELTDKGIPRFPTTKTTTVETYIREIVE